MPNADSLAKHHAEMLTLDVCVAAVLSCHTPHQKLDPANWIGKAARKASDSSHAWQSRRRPAKWSLPSHSDTDGRTTPPLPPLLQSCQPSQLLRPGLPAPPEAHVTASLPHL